MESPAIDSIFRDIRVSLETSASGRSYVAMKLRGSSYPFSADVEMNQRGLRSCQRVAARMGLPLYITPEAKAAMGG